ncbi:hypothetical protein CAPTEDRAFT_210780 [Capitella teleta]|uniref:Uncharacterized protein n=1 Tax=Capitella teleta TaxID=283909 RepID=R7TF05_CAPTE|nr:hypothetical protein CAPTEDRAFT_210780 [Capitella teleta]|eukprot:ELT92318.1 hypothetical protein CAPTEDRAFT_210780 [Capitella teleta]
MDCVDSRAHDVYQKKPLRRCSLKIANHSRHAFTGRIWISRNNKSEIYKMAKIGGSEIVCEQESIVDDIDLEVGLEIDVEDLFFVVRTRWRTEDDAASSLAGFLRTKDVMDADWSNVEEKMTTGDIEIDHRKPDPICYPTECHFHLAIH